jgi:hypothetical protein
VTSSTLNNSLWWESELVPTMAVTPYHVFH